MLELLEAAERELPALIAEPGWTGLHIDYETPHVDRAWRPWRGGRLNLHAIAPCANALYHPHPWPSAMRVLRGRYEMGIGRGSDAPPLAARLVCGPGTAYEMTDRDAWHYVRPLEPVLTIMVTGAPWDRSSPKPPRPLRPLSPEALAELLARVAAAL